MLSKEALIKANDKIFSGLQPTGDIHIGNYFGAIKNWVELTKQYFGIFCVVDFHAITIPYNPKELQTKIRETVVSFLSCGLDPERCIIFVQSEVPEHTELEWYLGTLTPLGMLERMTQFKDKSDQHNANINLGLLAYPVLQTADIILYNANLVPVGEDQQQHLELAREIVRKFNYTYKKEIFLEPKTLLSNAPRIMGLDGKSKMSKSKDNHIAVYLNLKELKKRINMAFTDPKRITLKDCGDPEVCNVFSYHKLVTDKEQLEKIAEGCRTATMGCGECKNYLAENLFKVLEPIQLKRRELEAHPDYVTDIMKHGAKTAKDIAEANMSKVRKLMGLR